MLATLIGFLGSACGTVGGVGGGGIFVPMLTLILGFDTKSAAAISKCKREGFDDDVKFKKWGFILMLFLLLLFM